ncbi:MAG TPA: nuclear transport factor 2 family protein [Pyrinomonadaceae bacterium]|nr:nuclear transport factor 2 family protein [Pyrinomonadaceae bacterium]
MRRMPVCLLLFSVAILAAPLQDTVHAQAKSKRDAITIAAVRTVLDAQRDAWNRGDIEGFMDGYARMPEITFVSGDTLTRGWRTVHDRYQKNYDSREKMGTLTFSDLETSVLSNDAAMTIGRWHLKRANDQPHGRFTLIFRRTRQGWRIVHDHTSSAP